MFEFLRPTLEAIRIKPSTYTVIITGAPATVHEVPLQAHEDFFKQQVVSASFRLLKKKKQTKKQREKTRAKENDPEMESQKEKHLSRADVEEFINSTHRFLNLLREVELEYIAQAKKLLQ